MIKNERCIPVLPNLPLPNLDDSSPENIAKCDLVFDMIYDWFSNSKTGDKKSQ